MKVLETQHLIVRHLRVDDLADLLEVCGDPDVMLYMGDGRPLSREQTEKWIEKSQVNYRQHGFGCFAVVARESHKFVGFCGLVNPSFGKVPEAEIIYALKKEHWGQGLAREVAGAMIEFGFGQCHLQRIVATIAPENSASVRIVERLGLKCQGDRTDEHGLPEVVYAIENPEQGF